MPLIWSKAMMAISVAMRLLYVGCIFPVDYLMSYGFAKDLKNVIIIKLLYAQSTFAQIQYTTKCEMEDLVRGRHNSSVFAMELCLSCTNTSIWF